MNAGGLGPAVQSRRRGEEMVRDISLQIVRAATEHFSPLSDPGTIPIPTPSHCLADVRYWGGRVLSWLQGQQMFVAY